MTTLHASEKKMPVNEACLLFGHSRQSYYKSLKQTQKRVLGEEIILDVIREIRNDMPQVGGRKLHKLLMDRLPANLLMGRDALFGLLANHGLLIRGRKYKPHTTDSKHRFRKYPNLIRGYVPTASGQLYVSDITYIEVERKKFYYLSLVTDAYSRKIVGWHLSRDLKTKSCVKALLMALEENKTQTGLIHHSDRGTQYCSVEYVSVLNTYKVSISMTENGDPLENAIAERVNGILKTEWLNHMQLGNIKETRHQAAKVIDLYNNVRPHMSIEMLTPQEAHGMKGELQRQWKNYYALTKAPVQAV